MLRSVEIRGPLGGDANADGTPDDVQPGVAAVPAKTTGQYVVVDASGYALRNVRAITTPDLAACCLTCGPGDLPLGLFGFEVHGVTPGGTAAVRLTLPTGLAPSAYFKQDPATGTLSRFNFNGNTGAVIAGNVVTLHLTDGGRGDADGLVNGVIVDPGGPGGGPNPTRSRRRRAGRGCCSRSAPRAWPGGR